MLTQSRADIDGIGGAVAVGVGNLVAKVHRLGAGSYSGSVGTGALVVPTLSKVTGNAVAIAGGPAVLVPALSKVLGAGLSESYGVAALAAHRAIIDGVVVGVEGTGDLVAQAASVSGEGRIDEPFIWQPDEPRGSYPYYDPAVWYPNPGTAVAYPLATGLDGTVAARRHGMR